MVDIKITDVKTYIVPSSFAEGGSWSENKPFLFVKLETNKGLDGWGEAYVLRDRERSTEMVISEMKRYLLDYSPRMIKYFQHWSYTNFAESRPGIDLFCAVSAVEIAMWDILGKYYKTPIYNLLGGPVHRKIRLYANLASYNYKSPDEVAKRAKEMMELGFTAVKMYPFDYNEDDDSVIERVRKVREAVGEKVDLMIDVWRQAHPEMAVKIARRLEPLNIIWYEEPISSDNLDVLSDIKRRITLPVVTGECIWGKRAFNEVFRKGAADIINPDVSVVGGILELKEIAAMAEANYVRIGPHNCNSTTVSTSATVHAACTMPNFMILEIFPSFWEIGDKICNNQLQINNGYFTIPEAPGLGLEMNEEFLAALVYRRTKKKQMNF